jgi:ectoine hydroxylase-related dioxygenase (phytanoyl-CoA dioxygenase family)
MSPDTATISLTMAERELLPSDHDIQRYEEHGWYLSKRLLSNDEVARLVAASERFYAGAPDRRLPVRPPDLPYWEAADGEVQRQNDYIHYESEEIARILRKPIIGAVAARLARAEQIRVFQSTLIYKPPKPQEPSNRVPWHADRHYSLTCTSEAMLTAFIPMHDCGEDFGTITMVDGSHQWADLLGGSNSTRLFSEWELEKLDQLVETATHYNGAEVRKVPMIIPQGHMSFHHCRIYHGSGPNRRAQPRRAISFNLQNGENRWREFRCPDGSLLTHHHDVLVRRTAEGTPDYADPDFCPVLWGA